MSDLDLDTRIEQAVERVLAKRDEATRDQALDEQIDQAVDRRLVAQGLVSDPSEPAAGLPRMTHAYATGDTGPKRGEEVS